MALFNITFDSVEKKLTVTIDGKAVENVVGIECYSDGNPESMWPDGISVRTSKYDEESKVYTYVTLNASKKGLVEVDDHEELLKALGQKLLPHRS